MSYILDALNKSEQERQSKQTPGINSVHRQPIPTPKKSKPWLIALIVLSAVNGVGIYFWLQQNKTTMLPAPQKMPAYSEQEKLITKPEIELANPLVQTSNVASNVAPARIDTLNLVNISDLPPAIKAEIPNLNFSTHFYGEDQDFRMVNINGMMIREGEAVTDKVQLIEITEQGVILQYKQYLFEVGVLTNWQVN